MYFEDHNPPHFHIIGNDGREAEVLIDGLTVKKGAVDRRALREALDWAQENRTLLTETWDAYQSR
ncbi:MAG TPA: DUF4160 domain-containing protein [Rhodobacteraceae bacterium]|nr:DUF4160 domain-containing protein [Paracoccaceae bacterium]